MVFLILAGLVSAIKYGVVIFLVSSLAVRWLKMIRKNGLVLVIHFVSVLFFFGAGLFVFFLSNNVPKVAQSSEPVVAFVSYLLVGAILFFGVNLAAKLYLKALGNE